MTVWTKTANVSVLSLQSVASNTVVISTPLDVSTKFTAFFGIHFGRRTTPALTVGAKIRIEGSVKSSGDGFWFPLVEFLSAIAAAESEVVTGTVAAGATAITVASTTNLTVGDLIYIDNGTIANSEWARIKAVSANVNVTVEDALINAQTGATIYDQAELFTALVDVSAVSRVRVVIDCSGTGQAVAIEAVATTADALS